MMLYFIITSMILYNASRIKRDFSILVFEVSMYMLYTLNFKQLYFFIYLKVLLLYNLGKLSLHIFNTRYNQCFLHCLTIFHTILFILTSKFSVILINIFNRVLTITFIIVHTIIFSFFHVYTINLIKSYSWMECLANIFNIDNLTLTIKIVTLLKLSEIIKYYTYVIYKVISSLNESLNLIKILSFKYNHDL